MLESLKAFAQTEPQQEKIRDEYTLDEVSFKRLFRQIFTLAENYKDVPRTECTGDKDDYWIKFAQDIATLSKEWTLRDSEGREIIDQATGCRKFHPLFFHIGSAIMDAYSDIWKARRT